MRATALMVAASLAGCSRSQLVVRVDSDAGNVRIVALQVRGPAGVGGTATAAVGASGAGLPVTLGVVAQGDVSGPVTITAIGMNDGRAELVRQQVRTRFAAGATRSVDMTLDPACEARFCHAPTETCVAGCCVGTDAALDAIAAGATGATCAPDDVVDVVPGAGRTCARRLGGNVDCWGTESTANLPYDTRADGQYGDARAELSSVAELGLGETFGCARVAGDALECWGANYYGQVQLPASGDATTFVTRSEPIAATRGIAVGRYHFCAILASSVTCQGAYDRGLQAATTDAGARSTTLAVALPNVEQLAAGRGFTCARLSTGEVDCWGSDEDGQLGAGQAGDDGTATRLTPLPVVGITDAVDLAAGESHACVVRADGSAWCWGKDADGQLGDGASAPMRATPVRVGALQPATAIAAGNDFTCAIAGAPGSAAVWCWGNDAHHQLGGATATAPIAAVVNPVRIAAGPTHACAVAADGTALCWGSNASGEITGGTAGAATTMPPTRVPPP